MDRPERQRYIVIQTAFLGDVVLTLPLIQALRKEQPGCSVDFLVVPRCAEIAMHHPDVRRIIVYDKRGADAGVSGFLRHSRLLRAETYDCAFIPHRSLRSALLAWWARIPVRVGFDTSAGRSLLTTLVHYDTSLHEIGRNLSLLDGIGLPIPRGKQFPSIAATDSDREAVDTFLGRFGPAGAGQLVAIAPGTVWRTKQWLPVRYAELLAALKGKGYTPVLVGGPEDERLCEEVAQLSGGGDSPIAAGKLTIRQSADLLRRCRLLVCNDSAPLHLAVAARTPVVAIFGATIPAFGFAPYGDNDAVVEIHGLPCRPCAIHGGQVCPIGTFDCMNNISTDMVLSRIEQLISSRAG